MTKVFMNQQFHRPLPIRRVVCVNRRENSTEPQSFPDPPCSLGTAEGGLHGTATEKERAEVLGTELVPGMVLLHLLLQLCKSQRTG